MAIIYGGRYMKIIRVMINTVMITTMVAAQDLIEDTDGNLYEVWDTDLTIMLQEVTTGKTIEFNKESDAKSSNYNRYTLENNRQVWENFTKRPKQSSTGLSEPLEQECRICDCDQGNPLDLLRGCIRQDKPR